jgi:hypothetical protein
LAYRIQRWRSRICGGFPASAGRGPAVIHGWRAALAVPALAALPVLPAGPARVGVGIGAGPYCPAPDVPLQAGHSYSLGAVYVKNTGSGPEGVTLAAGPLWKGDAPVFSGELPPGPSWFSFGYPKLLGLFSRGSVTVQPGQGADVPATLNLPAGVRPECTRAGSGPPPRRPPRLRQGGRR